MQKEQRISKLEPSLLLMMNRYFLFTDASLDPQLKIGVGGYLFASESLINTPSNLIKTPNMERLVVLRNFKDTSSTRLEVETVLWALEEIDIVSQYAVGSDKLRLYTDSQCVAGLLPRRVRLEDSGFHGKRGNRLLRNASLYKRYYSLCDRLEFEVVKVAGHTPSGSRNALEQIFSIVDQKVRKALKSLVSHDSYSSYIPYKSEESNER